MSARHTISKPNEQAAPAQTQARLRVYYRLTPDGHHAVLRATQATNTENAKPMG